MFDLITVRASERGASQRFYRTVLDTLGIEPVREGKDITEWDGFSIAAADAAHPPTRHLHLAFVAPSHEHVDRFWQTGVQAGYRDDGRPGERPQYKPDYYGGFLLDPDGNSVEAVHHDDTRRGGCIDHLWIRVSDLQAAEAFYLTVARHTGLRAGRRWNGGVQFRGAWATFSLVHDGRPASEQLHMAFPARDRETVDGFHQAATAAGYRSYEAPGGRQDHDPGDYCASVLDPDQTIVESVFHAPS